MRSMTEIDEWDKWMWWMNDINELVEWMIWIWIWIWMYEMNECDEWMSEWNKWKKSINQRNPVDDINEWNERIELIKNKDQLILITFIGQIIKYTLRVSKSLHPQQVKVPLGPKK